MKLYELRNWIVLQQVRFSIGLNLLALVNFSLLIYTNSERILKIMPFKSTYLLLIFSIPFAFICVWLVGTYLDKYVKYLNTVKQVHGQRDPYLNDILAKIKIVNDKFDKLELLLTNDKEENKHLNNKTLGDYDDGSKN